VKFAGGLLGELKARGSFDVARREIGEKEWQITETHVHMQDMLCCSRPFL
jgi:hypothetical protein